MGVTEGAMGKVSKRHEMDQSPRERPYPTRWTKAHEMDTTACPAVTHHIEHSHGQYDGCGDDRQGDPRPRPVGDDAR